MPDETEQQPTDEERTAEPPHTWLDKTKWSNTKWQCLQLPQLGNSATWHHEKLKTISKKTHTTCDGHQRLPLGKLSLWGKQGDQSNNHGHPGTCTSAQATNKQGHMTWRGQTTTRTLTDWQNDLKQNSGWMDNTTRASFQDQCRLTDVDSRTITERKLHIIILPTLLKFMIKNRKIHKESTVTETKPKEETVG